MTCVCILTHVHTHTHKHRFLYVTIWVNIKLNMSSCWCLSLTQYHTPHSILPTLHVCNLSLQQWETWCPPSTIQLLICSTPVHMYLWQFQYCKSIPTGTIYCTVPFVFSLMDWSFPKLLTLVSLFLTLFSEVMTRISGTVGLFYQFVVYAGPPVIQNLKKIVNIKLHSLCCKVLRVLMNA